MTEAQGVLRPRRRRRRPQREARKRTPPPRRSARPPAQAQTEPRRRGAWPGGVRRTSPASIGATTWRRWPARENVAADAGDLTGLHRGADTAGQLGALRDAMRGTEAGAEGGEGSVFRFSQHDDTASVHEACGPDVVVDIPPGATVPGVDAPELHSTVSPPQPPPGVRLQLLGGGDRPPRPAVSESDFPAVYRRLYDLRNIDEPLAGRYIARAAEPSG